MKNDRQKKKSLDFVKSILAFAFSQVGVVVLCVMYAVGGARIYMSMEVPENVWRTFFFFVHWLQVTGYSKKNLCKVPFEEEAYLAKQKEAKVEEYAALKERLD